MLVDIQSLIQSIPHMANTELGTECPLIHPVAYLDFQVDRAKSKKKKKSNCLFTITALHLYPNILYHWQNAYLILHGLLYTLLL